MASQLGIACYCAAVWVLAVGALRTAKARAGVGGRLATLEVAPLCITWTSTALASTVARRGRHRVLRAVYSCGALFGALGLVVALVLLAANLGANVLHVFPRSFRRPALPAHPEAGSTHEHTAQDPRAAEGLLQPPSLPEAQVWAVKPLIPGLNLPLVHLSYVFVAVLLSLVFHEAGVCVCVCVKGGGGENGGETERGSEITCA